MPTIEHPRHYPNTTDLAASHANQSFFKSFDEDFFEDTDGDVESATGWFGVFHLTDDMIREFLSTESDPAYVEGVKTGWYMIVLDHNGLIWAMHYGTDESGEAETAAREAFAQAQDTHTVWQSQTW